MKQIINKILYSAAILLTGVSATSCNDFLKEYSQDLAKVNSWEDLDEVLLGEGYLHIGRLYSQNSYLASERDDHFDILHFMSDEIRMGEDTYNMKEYYDDMFSFFTWQRETGLDTELRYVGGDEVYFNSPYKRINVCNMVISLIDEQPSNSETDDMNKRRVKGEAYFLRALYYFTLANLYCEPYNPASAASAKGMPLKFTEVIEDKEFERATLAETYEKVLEDLENAEECLEGISRKSVYHADINAVHLLQSRVYLYMQQWDKAIEKAHEVLNANDKLQNVATIAIGDNCLDASSPEIIFTMGDYLIAFYFQDQKWYTPSIFISDDMLNLYSDSDYRKNRYIGETSYNRKDVFRKINGQREAVGSYTTVGSVFCFRTPEAYFTLAEASAYKGDEATARSMMEKFRATRISGDVTVTESGNDLIDLIRNERAREFLLEGHRWFDLRRYTVCQPYPWSKEIIHGVAYEAQYKYDHTDWYKLEKNDQAYTLPLPRTVKNFQVSLGSIDRPARPIFRTTNVHASSLEALEENENGEDNNDDDDWDDDDWW